MGTLYRVKSDNFWAGAEVGASSQWVHIDAGNTGRTTITPANVSAGAIKPILFQNMIVNNTGNGKTTLADSARGNIAILKSSVQEKDYHYNIPLRGNLTIDNDGGADLTVVYIRD